MRQLISSISFSKHSVHCVGSIATILQTATVSILISVVHCADSCVCIFEQLHLNCSSQVTSVKCKIAASTATVINTDQFMTPFAHYPIRIRDQKWKHLTFKFPTHMHARDKIKTTLWNKFKRLIKHTQFMCWFVRFTARKMNSTISLSDEAN